LPISLGITGVLEHQIQSSSNWLDAGGPDPAPPPVPTPASDQATIEEAEDRLAKDAASYWRDKDLQDRYSAALERRHAPAAPDPAAAALPPIDHWAIERARAHRDVQRFQEMLRDEKGSREYWNSASLKASDARWRDDSLAPTTSIGMPIKASSWPPLFYRGDIAKLQFIAITGSPILNVAFY
jgi:hypothetical protein